MNARDEQDISTDPIWDLLRQCPTSEPGPRFAADVVRAARLMNAEARPWWRGHVPALASGIAAVAGITAALALMTLTQRPATTGPLQQGFAQADVDSLDDLDDLVLTEAVYFAAENPGDFNDAELVNLITH